MDAVNSTIAQFQPQPASASAGTAITATILATAIKQRVHNERTRYTIDFFFILLLHNHYDNHYNQPGKLAKHFITIPFISKSKFQANTL